MLKITEMKPYSFIRLSLLLPLFGSMFLSCSNDNGPLAGSDSPRRITFDCRLGGSRATDTSFESNDKIGVYVVKGGTLLQPAGNVLNNELFSYNGTAWTASRDVFWSEGSFDVYAYYPHAVSVGDTEDFSFSVARDQSSHEGYTSADFLWAVRTGVAASADPVALTFSHRMSKALVELQKAEGYEGEIPADAEVYIHSTVTDASVDLSTGDVSKAMYGAMESIHAFKKSPTEFEAIVVPQNLETRRPLVEVVAGGVSYLMEGKISFRQGYSHRLVVTLSKNPEQTKIEIGGSIGGWTE